VRGSSRPVAPGYQRHLRDTAPPSAVKALTSEQRGRLQTFPKDWRWHGTKTDIDQMVGNAVPGIHPAEAAGRYDGSSAGFLRRGR
jgi:DNA (cytosine-5)-methyltransferase 1